ncbi:related to CAF120 CCR4 Associated Factor 120 kDa [Fusarium torulosum]|uniref:Related to CAF120 CCR4 Associated Factor 120 kDa n=1 Tax=Fusarium torulosum TaxID=33205 RepID=A0AAE8SJN1_9HYPO|nr:related to CAF120 CCR4 Associated Factor 120 kDa [Fusarium torulosum]
MSQFSAGTKTPPPSTSPPSNSPQRPGHRKTNSGTEPFPDHRVSADISRPNTPPSRPDYGTPLNGGSPIEPSARRRRSSSAASSRPPSMVLAHQPPIMDITEDTIPELQPIFSFLNSHSNKLYQEGYFLKLDDQNTQGKPNPDRTWTECFAQLVGTVLSLWDAGELDAAGEDGEVLPKFINLTDASIKMIESLPTRSADEQPLQNILSISTAGRNRYLLHFNSRHSLLQWTAGIRLAIFEHSSLQEAYTGALIAGKGKTLNNIGVIMERARFPTEEWVRVRFGAGVPWRRCWCVITPPDEKQYAKLQKELKKRSPYDRSPVPTLKGDIKFYDQRKDGKKQKKMQPIATITDAYSAYAIYPQSKNLIDASTLLKVEGNIDIHTDPPSSTEGFVFIMPETRPAVSGFEMLLRFLFPTWDTFGLYGRPGRLVASTLDSRSLMFAMPKSRRYGYLENLDVSNLILEDGSSGWGERDWRKKLKESTGTRMNAVDDSPTTRSRSNSRKSVRLSFGDGPPKPKTGHSDQQVPTRSSRSFSLSERTRTDSAPADPARVALGGHGRNSSDPNHLGGPPLRPDANGNSPYSGSPQRGQTPVGAPYQNQVSRDLSPAYQNERPSGSPPLKDLDGMRQMHTPEPVSRPPAFNHGSQARPVSRAYHSPELRRANSRLSVTTLAQLATAGGLGEQNGSQPSPREDEVDARSGPSVLPPHANSVGISANDNRSREGLNLPNQDPSSNSLPPPANLSQQRSRSPLAQSPLGPPSPYGRGPNSRPGTSEGRRSPMPPGMPPQQRPPHPQNTNRRPDMGPDGRRPSDPRRPGPDGRRPSDPRGPGFDGRRPSDPRGRGNGPPPGYGPPPPGGPYGNYRPGQGRPPGPPGPPGPHGPPGSRPNGPPGQMTHRKPVPGPSVQGPPAPFDNNKGNTMSGSSAITTNEIIDHYAYDQGRQTPREGTPNSDRRPPPPDRQESHMSNQSSHYDDNSPTSSLKNFVDTYQYSEPKPRAGVLKTVGGAEELGPGDPGYGIPNINFGPTINYAATQDRNKSSNPGGASQRPHTPGGHGPTPPPHKSSGSQGSLGRNESPDPKRTMAWQPGTSAPSPGSHGLSAEEFVQQRAAHARSASGNTLGGRSGTPSPGMNRTNSSDMLQAVQNGRHSRSSSADLLSRPGSRGANSSLNFASSGETSSHLSARDQEHIARVTGQPLINMPAHQRQGSQGHYTPSHQRQASSGSGLVGAIEAREREKQHMKQGISSQAVQQAINQRQHQQAAMAYQQQMAQQQMAQQQMMQQQLAQQQQMAYQQQVQQQQQQQQSLQQGYQQPHMGAGNMPAYSPMGQPAGQYTPGGSVYGAVPQQMGGHGQANSFSRPMRAAQQVDPRFVPPQGQYSPAAGPQQNPKGVHPQYQGQAF